MTSSALVVAMVVLGTAACIGGRASPGAQHHVLSPVIEAPSGDAVSPGTARVVGVGPVSLPAYLDRPQIVMRPVHDTIAIMEFEQWGEPLRDGVTRVLAVNLARLLPDSVVVVFPWRSTEKVRYQVVVEVAQMDGPPGGSLALDARWRVLDRSGNEIVGRVLRLGEPTGAGTTAAAVSRALGTLSRDIARELGATDGGRR